VETPAATPGLAPAAPDWANIQEQVSCPLCGYELRGLVEPRCPECGYRFDWPDLLDPTRRRHRYLFEYYPDRNLWSFWRTAAAGLRPARFWKSLSPVQPSSPRRLTIYGLVVGLSTILFGPVLSQLLMALTLLGTGNVANWGDALVTAWNSDAMELSFVAFAYYLLWAVATCLSLLVFRISMRRARIRPVHVARCVVYSFDAIIWPGLAAFVATATVIALALLLSKRDFSLRWQAVAIAPWVVIAVVEYRLVMAYRHYLRFDRPFLTILASQIAAGLVVLNVLVYVENLRH
jgi:hypothetical protein